MLKLLVNFLCLFAVVSIIMSQDAEAADKKIKSARTKVVKNKNALNVSTFSLGSLQNEFKGKSGTNTQEKPLTPVQKIRKRREQLERKNEMLVKQQVERMRLQNELDLRRKILKSL